MVKYKVKYRTGQVINIRGENKFSKLISMGYGDYWTHSLWIRQELKDKILIQEADGLKEKKVVSKWVDKSYFDNLFSQNRAKIMNFNLNSNPQKFEEFCNSIEGVKYDYFTIFELFVMRVMNLFGLSEEAKTKILRNKPVKKAIKKLNPEYKSVKKLDCSEMIAFGIYFLKGININEELNLRNDTIWDYIRPQHISLLNDKLETDSIKYIEPDEMLRMIKEELEGKKNESS